MQNECTEHQLLASTRITLVVAWQEREDYTLATVLAALMLDFCASIPAQVTVRTIGSVTGQGCEAAAVINTSTED
jgi:hypothetical protein